MAFDLDKCCEQLNSSDRDAALALKVAVDAIPVSLPVLPFLYAKYRSTSNHALRSWTFATIGRFEELAIPFIYVIKYGNEWTMKLIHRLWRLNCR